MLNLLQQNYWWPGSSSAMKEDVRKCHECQIVTKQHNIEPMKPEMSPEGPFQSVAVDFKGPFYDGYYALVFVDLYSRWPEAYFVKSTNFNEVEKHFLRYFATYGTPLKIKSDNGPPFIGEKFSNFRKIHGFKHWKLTPKHSQANREINQILHEANKESSGHCKGVQSRLQSRIMWRTMADRATPHTITERSPYVTLFGRKMRVECISPENRQHQLRNNKEDNMREFVDKKKKKSKAFYDVKYKAKKHDFHLEEEVPVKDKHDGEYIPDTFQIINSTGFSTEGKTNSDGKVVFQNASHFKVYHRRNHSMVNETQKVAHSKKDSHEQRQGTHKNALHMTYLGNQ